MVSSSLTSEEIAKLSPELRDIISPEAENGQTELVPVIIAVNDLSVEKELPELKISDFPSRAEYRRALIEQKVGQYSYVNLLAMEFQAAFGEEFVHINRSESTLPMIVANVSRSVIIKLAKSSRVERITGGDSPIYLL